MWLLHSLWLCTSLALTAEDSKLTKFLPVLISAPQGSGSGQLEVRKIRPDQLCSMHCTALFILTCPVQLYKTASNCPSLSCPGQVLLPTRGSSSIGSPAQLLEHVGASWEAVVEPHQVELPASSLHMCRAAGRAGGAQAGELPGQASWPQYGGGLAPLAGRPGRGRG